MLTTYYGTVDEKIKTRFQLYKPVVEYWVSLWAQVQISNKNCPGSLEVLEDMERKRFSHCLAILNSVAFKQLLDQPCQNERSVCSLRS